VLFRPTSTSCRRRQSAECFPALFISSGILAAGNATIQSLIADRMNHNYSVALAGVPFVGAIVIAGLVGMGREGRDVKMGGEASPAQ
jgi:MFS transporter, SHS family, lactate transporter